MQTEDHSIHIRPLHIEDEVPYALLLEADPSRAVIDTYLPLSHTYIAMVDDEPAGVYVLYPLGNNEVEIKNIAVLLQYRGKGIGTRMLADAILQAKQFGYRRIVIGTANSSIGQLYLYQKMGFELYAIRENFFLDPRYPANMEEEGLPVKHMLMLKQDI